MRVLLMAFLLTTALFGQTFPNTNFEKAGVIGALPADWNGYSIVGSGFWFSLTNQGCLEGSQCAVMGGPASAQSSWYGLLYQSFNPRVSGFTNRGFRMQAAVRVQGAGTSVRLWVGDGTSFLNVQSADITSDGWKYYCIRGSVGSPSSASFGFIISGSGTAWIDDVSFTAVDNESPESARALSDTGLANITAFAKVFGYVRHFHPSDQAFNVPWIVFATQGIRSVEGASSPEDLASRLEALFAPIAPTLRIFPTGSRPAPAPEVQPSTATSLELIRWNHYGVGPGTGSNVYHSFRETAAAGGSALPDGFQDPAQPFEAEIGRGLSVQVPLTLYTDSQGTLPHLSSMQPICCVWSADDRASRMAGIVVAWNVAQHFYPYFDVVRTDWPGALASALRSAATDSGANAYLRTISLLWAALHDGHGFVWGPNPSYGMVPLVWEWVENQLVVIRVVDGQGQNIAPGDRVLAINGENAEDAITAQEALISGATPQWIQSRALTALSSCDSSGQMSLDLEPYASPGSRRTVQLTCVGTFSPNVQPGDTVRDLGGGIMYLDLNRLTDADWAQALPRLVSADGIVFDLRGYPKTTIYFNYLSQTPLSSAQWHIPIPSKPDQVGMAFTNESWTIPVFSPYLTARRVFLTDGRAISFAETVMGIVENYRLAEIVGAATAGTNGNINYVYLPGGFSMGFTGMKVLKHDGSQHHGVGIHPTIPAARTRQGVAQGRDEVLERGVAVLKGPQPGPPPTITSVVNAASFAPGPVAPGEMVTIFGAGLGPAQLAQATYDSAGFLGTYAGETRVFFDEVQAPLVYASSNAVSAIAPYSVSSATKVRVEYQLRRSAEKVVPVTTAAPGIFSYGGGSRAVLVNQDQSFNSAANPAARGEMVTLFATGEGQATPAATTGRLPLAGKWPEPAGDVAVTFGGIPGEIQFKGLVAAGVLQVNVRVPGSAPAGDAVPVSLKAGGTSSQPATVSLK